MGPQRQLLYALLIMLALGGVLYLIGVIGPARATPRPDGLQDCCICPLDSISGTAPGRGQIRLSESLMASNRYRAGQER